MKVEPKDDNLDELFAAARKTELYDKGSEYGFETRVLARIRANRTENRPFLFWAWRLMPYFVLLVMCLTIWISFLKPSHSSVLIAEAGSSYEDAVVVSYLAGE